MTGSPTSRTPTRPLILSRLFAKNAPPTPGRLLDSLKLPKTLSLLALSRKTGCLSVRGDRDSLSAFVSEGRLRYVLLSEKRYEMLAVILGCPSLADRCEALFEPAVRNPGLEFALDLIIRHGLTQDEITAPLERFYLDCLARAAFWPSAEITYQDGLTPPSDAVPVSLDLAEAAEGLERRLEETTAFTLSLQPWGVEAVPHPASRHGRLSIWPGYYERQALTFVDGERPVHAIAAQMGMERTEVLSILVELQRKGYIDLAAPDGRPLSVSAGPV